MFEHIQLSFYQCSFRWTGVDNYQLLCASIELHKTSNHPAALVEDSWMLSSRTPAQTCFSQSCTLIDINTTVTAARERNTFSEPLSARIHVQEPSIALISSSFYFRFPSMRLALPSNLAPKLRTSISCSPPPPPGAWVVPLDHTRTCIVPTKWCQQKPSSCSSERGVS